MIRLFWKHFFALLLLAIAVAEWTCVAWLLSHLAGLRIPPALHAAAPILIYLGNRLILTRAPAIGGLRRTLRVAYTRFAFTSVFGFLLLLLVAASWSVTWAGLRAAGFDGDSTAVDLLGASARALATGGLLLVAGSMAYAYAVGAGRLWINRFEVAVRELPESMDGLRLVQISDLHAGPFLSLDQLAGYVERINALRPDLIVITGDLTDSVDYAGPAFDVLAGLRARLGVYAILGNHDAAAGAEAVAAELRRAGGIRLLLDEVAEVRDGDARLHLVGLRDRGLDWARGIRSCSTLTKLAAELPRAAPWILLSHRPDLFEQARRLGASLMLSGHTHGGQLAIPVAGRRAASLASFMTAYPRGTYRKDGCTLHVNLGLGMTGQPVRLATPREISVIELRSERAPRS